MTRVAVAGVLYALPIGTSLWSASGILWLSIVIASMAGVLLVVGSWQMWGLKALKGLRLAERREIWRRLNQGEPVRDPRLAGPAVRHANAFLAKTFRPRAARISFGVLAVLCCGLAAWDVADGRWTRLPSGISMAVFALVMAFVFVPLNARQRANAEQSIRATMGEPLPGGTR